MDVVAAIQAAKNQLEAETSRKQLQQQNNQQQGQQQHQRSSPQSSPFEQHRRSMSLYAPPSSQQQQHGGIGADVVYPAVVAAGRSRSFATATNNNPFVVGPSPPLGE